MQCEIVKTKAVISKITPKHIYVSGFATSECASCASLCTAKDKTIKIKYADGFSVGDEVYLSAPMGDIVQRSLLLYGLPVAAILVVALITNSLLKLPDALSAVLSLLSVPATYMLIKVFYKRKTEMKIEKA